MPGRPKILIVDDEKEVGTFFRHLFKAYYAVTEVYSGYEAEQAVETDFFDVAFVDLKLSDSNGLTILKLINEKIPHCKVIIMTGYSTVGTAVQAIRQGAFNYIEKPFDDLDYLRRLVTDALGSRDGLSLVKSAEEGFVIGTNPLMRNIASLARKIADKRLTVLIEGETGTGKEVLARFIHRHSDRADQPFLAVNCGAFSETLLESELFGHEKGAFTGATSARRGIFEMAHNGTLFLDEISEASMATQVKLLRMLENDEIIRVGGERPYKCDIRLIAATNNELAKAVKLGRFREDLYYRLNVINFRLPPLRERKEDIPLLVNHMMRTKFQKNNTVFSKEAMDHFTAYHWPGNVRELMNAVTQVLAICDGKEITLKDLPAKIMAKQSQNAPAGAGNRESLPGDDFMRKAVKYLEKTDFSQGINLPEILDEMKSSQTGLIREIIKKVQLYCGGNQARTAELLHISRRQLQYYLNEK